TIDERRSTFEVLSTFNLLRTSSFVLRTSSSLPNSRDRGAEVRRGVVAELEHERMPIERGLDDAALHAAAAAVYQPHFGQPCFDRRIDVFLDHRRDIAGSEAVEIELARERNAEGVQENYELRSTKYEVSSTAMQIDRADFS